MRGAKINMSYGRTAAAIELEKTVKLNSRFSSKVGTIMEEFYKGIKTVVPINNKSIFESFLKLWIVETKRRIESALIPENIKILMRNVVVGTGRRVYRTKMITKEWAPQKHLRIMELANMKHEHDYEQKKMEENNVG